MQPSALPFLLLPGLVLGDLLPSLLLAGFPLDLLYRAPDLLHPAWGADEVLGAQDEERRHPEPRPPDRLIGEPVPPLVKSVDDDDGILPGVVGVQTGGLQGFPADHGVVSAHGSDPPEGKPV